jgi:Tfp pilus assembly protein PilF
VFALHPVHVESVAWITARKDVLSAFFYLLAFLAYRRFDRVRAWGSWALALLLFACAMASKSVAVSLPVALWIVRWWKRERLGWREVWPAMVLMFLAAAISLADVWLMRTVSPGHYSLSTVQRGLIAGRALWFYLGKLVWPAPVMLFYPRWEVDARVPWQYLFPLGAVGLLVVLFLARQRLGRGPLAAALFFAVTLTPVLGFVDFSFMGYAFVADRFQYLASAGPIALFSAAAAPGLRRLRAGHRELRVGATALLLLLGLLTSRHAGVYRDEETLLRDTLAKNPRAWAAHLNLGNILKDRGEAREARRHYEDALRERPSFDYALNNLGLLLVRERMYAESAQYFQRAAQANPRYADAFLNLGYVQTHLGLFDKAVVNLTRARALEPSNATVRQKLGTALLLRGEVAAAVAEYRAALTLDPTRLETVYKLSWTLATHELAPAADPEDTVRLARRACALAGTSNPLALDTLAAALAHAGHFEEAAVIAGQALQAARTAGLRGLAGQVEERLALYRAGRPYREEMSSLLP